MMDVGGCVCVGGGGRKGVKGGDHLVYDCCTVSQAGGMENTRGLRGKH